MDDRDEWRESIMIILASSTTWWWPCPILVFHHIYIYIYNPFYCIIWIITSYDIINPSISDCKGIVNCGTIASRHLVGRWFRDYHMCRLVFLCFFPRQRWFQIRGKRRWLRSSRWRLEFVLERWKSCQANFKNDENKAFVINSNKRLFTQLFR